MIPEPSSFKTLLLRIPTTKLASCFRKLSLLKALSGIPFSFSLTQKQLFCFLSVIDSLPRKSLQWQWKLSSPPGNFSPPSSNPLSTPKNLPPPLATPSLMEKTPFKKQPALQKYPYFFSPGFALLTISAETATFQPHYSAAFQKALLQRPDDLPMQLAFLPQITAKKIFV